MHLTSLQAGEAVECMPPVTYGGERLAPFVLTCDHASNFIAPSYNGLGLGENDLKDHIAWDPGALPLARALGDRLQAPVIAAGASRLLIDVNRSLDAKDLIPRIAEDREIPGNQYVDAGERQRRIDGIYAPFHAAVHAQVVRHSQAGQAFAVISVHSFTPVFMGRRRNVQIGILHAPADAPLANRVKEKIATISSYDVRLNEPYGPEDGVLHTLSFHAVSRGVPAVMIEVRNDLLEDGEAQERIAGILERALREAWAAYAPAGEKRSV